MRVCLVRHGDAVDEAVDRQRPLSERGRKEVADVTSQLQKIGLVPDRIFHSHKTRAAQTAEILHDGLDAVDDTESIDGLSPGDPPDPVVARLSGCEGDVIVVGHLPSLEHIAAALLGDDAPRHIFSCSNDNRQHGVSLADTRPGGAEIQ